MFEKGSSFRDVINDKSVRDLASRIKERDPRFDKDAFVKRTSLQDLQFLERVLLIRDNLLASLTLPFEALCELLLDVCPPEIDPLEAGKTKPEHFIMMPLAEVISLVGCQRKRLQDALKTLQRMTSRFSSERAIRIFLETFPTETLAFLQKATLHENPHVRRWASEGTRPLLPQAPRVQFLLQNPNSTRAILEALKEDPHLYVRRSVANHINDLSKVDRTHTLSLLRSWKKSWQQAETKEREWLVKHACRWMVKQGDSDVLKLLSYTPPDELINAKLKITCKILRKRFHVGDNLTFKVSLTNFGKNVRLILSYRIEFPPQKKGQTRNPRKTFILGKTTLKTNESCTLEGSCPLIPRSTRPLYTGQGSIHFYVNGRSIQKETFVILSR